MDTLTYLVEKYKLDISQPSPVEIPNVGRNTLGKWFKELGFERGVELGTASGRFADVLSSWHPKMHLYCVDAYSIYTGYRDYTRSDEMVQMREEAHRKLDGRNVSFVEKFSMDALADFPDGSLDFVYIDANHEWPFVTHDIYYWTKKVRPGGIVAGHDYYRSTRRDSKCHVKGAVTGYTFAFRIQPWFLLGRDERRPGEVRDASRSWMWVR